MTNKSIALVSNLYPSSVEKTRGIFTKQLTDSMPEHVKITVVAPIPWRPDWSLKPERIVPYREEIDGVEVFHPRYLVTPKIFRCLYGWFFYLGVFPTLKKLQQAGKADIISTHWIYPDGVGSVLAAKKLHIPIALHALGCDINQTTKHFLRRLQIKYALGHANVNIVVSQALKHKLIQLGISEQKIKVILNGVNPKKFHPTPMAEARKTLALNPAEKYLLFIGNIQIEKGLSCLIDAVALIKDTPFTLLVVGSGRLESKIKEQIARLGIQSKVIFIGPVAHEMIPLYLSAANLLCLPSLREGCPNIVLESLSCGTPVLGSNVGAVPDMISKPEWGILVEPEKPEQFAQAISPGFELKNKNFPPFQWFDWQENATKVLEVLQTL